MFSKSRRSTPSGTQRDIDRAVDECVRCCGGRKRWFLYVVGFSRLLVRHRVLSERDAAEVIYRARKLLRYH